MNKRSYFLLIPILLLSIPLAAQIQKGNILVGGDIANFDLGLRRGSAFTMRINPKIAFFVEDNAAFGAYTDLGLFSLTGSTVFTYGVGVLGRYYLPDKKDIVPLRHSRLFAEANVGFTGANATNGGNSTNGLGIGVGPGIAYFISPNIGLEAMLKYNGIVGFGNATTQSDLNLNVGFQIYLSMRKTRSPARNI